MILQELVKYYERANEAGVSDLAPIGLEWKEISFAIVLDASGKFLDIEDLRSDDKKPRGRRCLVPQGIKRAAQVEAQPLWDKLSYVTGFEAALPEGKTQKKRGAEQEHLAFKSKITQLVEQLPDNKGLLAIKSFLNSADILKILQDHTNWAELAISTGNLSFRLKGEHHLVCEDPEIHRHFRSGDTLDSEKIRCLVSGKEDALARVHPSIKGILGAQSSGASIVSFNQDSFRSLGKEQGANSPIGVYAATAYTTALNSLLDRDSRQRIVLSDTSIIFWSDKNSTFEDVIFQLFGDQKSDDPNAYTEHVKALFKSPHTGLPSFDNDQTNFFVLGLAPNSARVSIRFWHCASVKEIATNIRQYFNDITMVKPLWLPDYPSLIQLLLSTALRGERRNIQPNLPSTVLKAIFNGTALPHALASAVLRRIRAEPGDSSPAATRNFYLRVALLKAYLNRRPPSADSEEKMTVELDENNKNIGYNLGRLFAVLERIQGDALGDINATIRDRYYGSASATPVTCFPRLMRLKNHHLAKIANKGYAISHEKKLTEIISHIPKEFPSHLSLADQGRFAIGYYHQRQIFFTPKDKSQLEENNVNT